MSADRVPGSSNLPTARTLLSSIVKPVSSAISTASTPNSCKSCDRCSTADFRDAHDRESCRQLRTQTTIWHQIVRTLLPFTRRIAHGDLNARTAQLLDYAGNQALEE